MRSFIIYTFGLVLISNPFLSAEVFEFELQPGKSPDPSSLSVEIDAGLIGDDDDTSSISGSALVELLPDAGPFTRAQIVELDLVLDDGFDFRLGFGGLLTASAAPGNVTATMVEPGPQVDVVDGLFDQPDNRFAMTGLVEVSVQDDPFDLSAEDPFAVDINGVRITEEGDNLKAELSLELIVETEIEDVPIFGSVPIKITLDGNALAFAPRSVSVPGDFDGDAQIGAADINSLSNAILNGSVDTKFDLNNDGSINAADRNHWIVEIANTFSGDSNLDGEFNTGDLVAAFGAGEYEDNVPMNSTWATGDWNGDLDFDSGDLVAAFQQGGFEQGPRPSATVPEPTSLIGLLFAAILCSRFRSKR